MLVPPDLSLVYILVLFFIAYGVIVRLILRPIVRVLDEREEEWRSATTSHARAVESADQKLATAEERLRGLRREAIARREARRAEGAGIRDEKLRAARAESERIVEEARSSLARQLPQLERELERQADALAGDVAERIMGRSTA